jgi:protein-L-isoaspartate O-methyltransferase
MTHQAQYYAQRAAEYDASVYGKPERQEDLARLRGLLASLVAGRRVLEIAAGTGYWTQVMSGSAAAITATDLSQETLQLARARRYGPAQVSFLIADAYAVTAVPGDFDLVFCGFWWSHILRADIPGFLGGLRGRLGPGTAMILLDNRYVPGSSQPVSRTGQGGDTYQQRRLDDGRIFEVVKNFPSHRQLCDDLAEAATGLRWTGLDYYWLAACVLR